MGINNLHLEDMIIILNHIIRITRSHTMASTQVDSRHSAATKDSITSLKAIKHSLPCRERAAIRSSTLPSILKVASVAGTTPNPPDLKNSTTPKNFPLFPKSFLNKFEEISVEFEKAF